MQQAHPHDKGLHRHLAMQMERTKKTRRLTCLAEQDLLRLNPRRERTPGFLALLGCRLPNKEEWPGGISMRSWKSSKQSIRAKVSSHRGSLNCWKCKYIISQLIIIIIFTNLVWKSMRPAWMLTPWLDQRWTAKLLAWSLPKSWFWNELSSWQRRQILKRSTRHTMWESVLSNEVFRKLTIQQWRKLVKTLLKLSACLVALAGISNKGYLC